MISVWILSRVGATRGVTYKKTQLKYYLLKRLISIHICVYKYRIVYASIHICMYIKVIIKINYFILTYANLYNHNANSKINDININFRDDNDT
jgi:hypothetical protein